MSRAYWLEAARNYGADFNYEEEIHRVAQDPEPYSELAKFMASEGNAAMLMLAAAKTNIRLKTIEGNASTTVLLFDGEGFKLCEEPYVSAAFSHVIGEKVVTPIEATQFIEADGDIELIVWQTLKDDLFMIHQGSF